MRLLVDTQALLWFTRDDKALSPKARHALMKQADEVWVSCAALWEIAIKSSLGKLQLPKPCGDYIRQDVLGNAFTLLEISVNHLERVHSLPFIHRDPFDRLMVAQAMEENLVLVTNDPQIRSYRTLKTLW